MLSRALAPFPLAAVCLGLFLEGFVLFLDGSYFVPSWNVFVLAFLFDDKTLLADTAPYIFYTNSGRMIGDS